MTAAAEASQQDGQQSIARFEGYRKLVHMAFGFVALSLAILPYRAVVLLAFSAIIFNVFILPRVGGKLIARNSRGHDIGIILYPIVVFFVVVVFRDRYTYIAGVAWCVLAFGDGAASLIGRTFGGPRLPWNRDKGWYGTIAFIEVGIPAAYAIALLLIRHTPGMALFLAVTITVVVAAIVESLPTRIDDNVTVTLSAALVMWLLDSWTGVRLPSIDATEVYWLIGNFVLATLGYLARSVSISGWIGGMLLGAILITFAGWPVYVALLAFFVIGTTVTKLGYRSKLARGLAQEEGGRRGFSHAFANVGVAVICALATQWTSIHPGLLWFLAVAALATAAADTTGSEVGQLLGRRTFLPLSFRRVEPGTEGAISLEGTFAGLVAGFVVSFIGVSGLAWRNGIDVLPWSEGWGRLLASLSTQPRFWLGIAAATAAAFLGSYAESVIGSFYRDTERKIPNGVMNFLNTLIGAAIAFALAWWLGLKP